MLLLFFYLSSLFYLFQLTLGVSESYWKDPARRRNFFETFAKKNSFNPLEPENWYSIRPEQVAAVPVCLSATSFQFFLSFSFFSSSRFISSQI